MAQRMYSLFRDGKRASDAAYPKSTAVRVFQSALINGAFSGHRVELKPVKDTTAAVDPNPLCPSCASHIHKNHVAEFMTATGAVRKCSCGCAGFHTEVNW